MSEVVNDGSRWKNLWFLSGCWWNWNECVHEDELVKRSRHAVNECVVCNSRWMRRWMNDSSVFDCRNEYTHGWVYTNLWHFSTADIDNWVCMNVFAIPTGAMWCELRMGARNRYLIDDWLFASTLLCVIQECFHMRFQWWQVKHSGPLIKHDGSGISCGNSDTPCQYERKMSLVKCNTFISTWSP